MAILDQYGNPYRYATRFAHAATRSPATGTNYPNVLDDIAVLIPRHDRLTLQGLSRRLYTNFGVLKAAVDQKANYSVGHAWQPCFRSPDADRAAAAEQWVQDRFYPLCDVRGPVFYWQECLQLISQALDRDGEAFVLLTSSKGGDARIQLIPSHRIGQRAHSDDEVDKGPYKGAKIRDGVIMNKVGRPVAYRILGDAQDGSQDYDISARDLIHVYDPDFAEQERGLPAFTHALTDFLKCLQSTEFETIAMMMVSSLGLIEYNDTGMPEEDPAFALQSGSTAEDGITTQLYAGGTTRYFKANPGAKLESVSHNRPGDMWERFNDRLIRSGLAGVQWPMALVWKSPGQGTAERSEVVRARRSIEQRQSTLQRVARRIVSYAVGVAFDRGELEPFARFWDVDFTLPPRLTVDDGRENAALLAQIESGALTMAQYQGYFGRKEEDHWREYWRGVALKERTREEVEAETGMQLTEPTETETEDDDADENE